MRASDLFRGSLRKEGTFIKKKKFSIFLAIVAFLLALTLTLYPLISTAYNTRHQSTIHFQYIEQLEQMDLTQLKKALEDAIAYNDSLSHCDILIDPFSKEGVEAASEHYEEQLNLTGNGIMGYVNIPSIDVELPIYHGTEASTLERGVGHLIGSSLPIGGVGTHSVLTGHSGMANNKMFTDLTSLKVGDVFYLNVLNDTLAYQVDQIEKVLPYDSSLLNTVPGKDYCTLVTCTPLGVNTHRLLVRGTRIPYEEAKVVQEERAIEEPEAESEWEKEYMSGLVIGIAIIVIVIIIILVLGSLTNRRGKYESR